MMESQNTVHKQAKTTRRESMLRLAASSAAIATASYSSGQESKQRIRIGQIGTKHAHAAGKLQTIQAYPDLFELVGVVEPDQARRESLQNKPPYQGVRWLSEQSLLNHPGLQAAAVETEVSELVPTAMRCLNAGIHIHLDKPAGESMSACRALHRLATEKQRTIQMGYMLRYNPAFEFAHRIVRDGWLGEITEVNGMMGKYMSDSGRIELSKYDGGGMFELACHLIDQVISLLGKPTNVTSFTRRTFPAKDTFADNQLAVFEYPRALATIRCNHIDPMGGPRRSFSITGTEGTFEIRPLEPPRGRLGLSKPRGNFKRGYQDVSFDRPKGRYDGEFIDLARVIRTGEPLAWDSQHDLDTHQAILQASGIDVD